MAVYGSYGAALKWGAWDKEYVPPAGRDRSQCFYLAANSLCSFLIGERDCRPYDAEAEQRRKEAVVYWQGADLKKFYAGLAVRREIGRQREEEHEELLDKRNRRLKAQRGKDAAKPSAKPSKPQPGAIRRRRPVIGVGGR